MKNHELLFTETCPPPDPARILKTMLKTVRQEPKAVTSDRFKALLILIISQAYGDKRKQFNICAEYQRLADLYRAGKL